MTTTHARAASGRRGEQAAARRHTACSQRCVRRAGEPRLSPPAPRRGGDKERGCGYLRLRLLAGGPLRARGCCSGDAERRCSSSGVPICVIRVGGRPLRAGRWGGVVPAVPCRRGARCGVRCEGSVVCSAPLARFRLGPFGSSRYLFIFAARNGPTHSSQISAVGPCFCLVY